MSTPSQPDDVPYEVQACPRCKSTEIHRRAGFHPFGRLGCPSCDRAFMITALQIHLLPAGQEPPRHWHWE